MYHYVKPSFVFYDSSYNRYRGRPYAPDYGFHLNSQGFKDREFGDKKPGVYRILGLGDSFAFGVVPYKDNYLTLLESELQQAGKCVEVLNMGIPGIGPREYLSLFVNEGLPLKPDMLLLSFFVGNDFLDVGERQIYTYSYVASLMYAFITAWMDYDGEVVHGAGEYCDDCPAFDEKTYLKIEGKRSFIFWDKNYRFSWLLNNVVHYMKELKDVCDKNHVKFVVVIIPDEIQLDKQLQQKVYQAYYAGYDKNPWHMDLPNRLLSQELDRLGISHIDLYGHFAKVTDRKLYRPRDSHWNIAGNRLAAQVLKDFLLDYVPKAPHPQN
jgi:hypothetical protein